MNSQNDSLQELQHIKKMMERSSRFISLSGLSGIAAGVCALAGAWIARSEITKYIFENSASFNGYRGTYIFKGRLNLLAINLLIIALATFAAAFITAFFLPT